MKKTLVSIAAASLLALNFTGCGSSSSSTPSKIKEVKVADIASVVNAMVKSGALTASQLGNGFYKFDAKPSEKMVSTAGFIDYNNNNEKDVGEPNALTLSADADKSTLNSLTTLVTESSKSEQEIANLFGLTVAELNSDTSLSNLEVQKRVVLANAIVKQVQSGSSSVATTTASVAVVTATATPAATTTPATATVTDVLPTIGGSSTATTTVSSSTATVTPSATATPAATPATTVVDTSTVLPTVGRSLRADAETSTTPPVLPTVGTASSTTTSTTSSVLPSTVISVNKYDDLLSQVSAKITAGSNIYVAVASVTGNESLKNLENANDSDTVKSINTALLMASTTTTDILPTMPVATAPVTIPDYTAPVVVTPTPTMPVITPTPTTPVVTPVPEPTITPVPDTSNIATDVTAGTNIVDGGNALVVTPVSGTNSDFGID
jgi:hypothetical protein